jgi:hypothetical protein
LCKAQVSYSKERSCYARLNCRRILRLITHRTTFRRLLTFDNVALRLEVGYSGSFVQLMSGQNSIMCFTDWLQCLHKQAGSTFGTCCLARNALNPIFSVLSWVARALSAFFRSSWRCKSFKLLLRSNADVCLSEGSFLLYLAHSFVYAQWKNILLLLLIFNAIILFTNIFILKKIY